MRRDDVVVLVGHRLEQADEVLEDARFLLEGNRSARSIINRVYYAMFYAVLALLQTLGRVPSRHTGAISLFDREFVQKGIFAKELSTSLHRAFEMRQTSDYRVQATPTQAEARELWNKAVRFVLEVKEYVRHGEYGQMQDEETGSGRE